MNIGKERDGMAPDAVQYARALRPPYHLLSFLRIKVRSINTTQELETKLHGLKFYNHGYTRPLLKIPSTSSLSVLNGS